jgi:hypothetical protein
MEVFMQYHIYISCLIMLNNLFIFNRSFSGKYIFQNDPLTQTSNFKL